MVVCSSTLGCLVVVCIGEHLQTMCSNPEMENSFLQLSRLAFQVASTTRSLIRQHDSQEDLHFLRLRLSDSEIMIVPGEQESCF